MNEYRLIKPSSVLDKLNEVIEDELFPCFESEEYVNYWRIVRNNLTEHQFSEYISWNNIEIFESIHYLEAIFLLLDLPTRFLLEYKEFNLYDSPYKSNCSDTDVTEVFTNTIECLALQGSDQDWRYDNPYGEDRNGSFGVRNFIAWCLEKGFIQKLDTTPEYGQSKNPLGKYNNYRGWAKAHNTIATLVALELYEGRLESTSSKLKDRVFYENLSKKLVSKERDGKDKPKSKTLENYISEFNNPPEK